MSADFIVNGMHHALCTLGHPDAHSSALWQYEPVVNAKLKQVSQQSASTGKSIAYCTHMLDLAQLPSCFEGSHVGQAGTATSPTNLPAAHAPIPQQVGTWVRAQRRVVVLLRGCMWMLVHLPSHLALPAAIPPIPCRLRCGCGR